MSNLGSFNYLYCLTEVAFIYKKDTSTIRKHIKKGIFKVDTDVKKFGKSWVMTEQAMISIYGSSAFNDYVNNNGKAEYLYSIGAITFKEKIESELGEIT